MASKLNAFIFCFALLVALAAGQAINLATTTSWTNTWPTISGNPGSGFGKSLYDWSTGRTYFAAATAVGWVTGVNGRNVGGNIAAVWASPQRATNMVLIRFGTETYGYLAVSAGTVLNVYQLDNNNARLVNTDIAQAVTNWGTINNVTDLLYVPSSNMLIATWVTSSGSGFYSRNLAGTEANGQISANTRCFTSFIHPTTRTIIWGCSGSFFYTSTANKPLGSGSTLPTKVSAGGGDYISGVLSASQNRLYLGSSIGLGILINLNTYAVEQLFFLVGNGALTQLTSAWLDETPDVIFWGTSDGRVARVNGNSFKNVMAVALSNGTSPLGAVHHGPDPSNAGQNITYFHSGLTTAAYNYFSYSLQKSNCPGYACSSCMGSGIVDSNYCGFCPSLSSCATSASCTGTGWTQSGVCPAAMPDSSTPTGSISGGTQTTFRGSYFDTSTSNYNCIYSDNAGHLVSASVTTLTSTSVVCAAPSWSFGAGTVNVAVARDGRTWATGWTFTYYDCRATTSCSTCGSGVQTECGWCFYTASCSARSACSLATSAWDSWSTARCPTTSFVTNASIARATTDASVDVVVPVSFYVALPTGFNYYCLFSSSSTSQQVEPYSVVASTAQTIATGTSYLESITCPFDPAQFTGTAPASTMLYITLAGSSSASSPLTYKYGVSSPARAELYYCPSFTVCATCTSSAHSRCDWCGTADGASGSCIFSATGTCSTGTSTNVPCSSISRISPTRSVLGAASSSPLTVTAQNVPAASAGDGRCWFTFADGSTASTVYTNPSTNTYSCNTPSIPSAQTIAVALGTTSGIVTNSANFVVYSCATRSTCGTCIIPDTEDVCNWCMEIATPSCVESTASCTYRVTGHDNSTCPALTSSSPSLFPMTGASNVTLIGNHLLRASDAPSALCHFALPGSNTSTTTLTYVSATELLCDDVPSSAAAGSASISVVNAANTRFTNSVNVSYVTCSQFSDCGSCLGATLNGESFCEWCGASCVSTCSSTSLLHEVCPVITSITPNFSILTGGDKIQIHGSGFLVGAKKRSVEVESEQSSLLALLGTASNGLISGLVGRASSATRKDSLATGYSCYWDSATETAVTVESSTLMTCDTPARSTAATLPLTINFDGNTYLTTPGIEFFSCSSSSTIGYCSNDCTAIEHCGWCVGGSSCTSEYQCSLQTTTDWQSDTCATVTLDYTTIPVTGDVRVQANLSRPLPDAVADADVLCSFGALEVPAALVYELGAPTTAPIAPPTLQPAAAPLSATPIDSTPVEAPLAVPIEPPVAVPVDAPVSTPAPTAAPSPIADSPPVDEEPIEAPVPIASNRVVAVTCSAPAVLSPTTTTFSVLYRKENFVAPVPFVYDDCTVHKGCTECISNANCGWCSRGNKCMFEMQCNGEWSKVKCPLNKVAVGVGVGIGLFALILLVLLALFLIRRARKNRGLVIAVKEPDYNAIAWGADTTLWWRVPDHRYKLLETALSRRDFLLQVAIAFNCPATEQDALAKAMVYVAQTHGLAADMIQKLIRYEVQTCKAENTLFRNNSVASKMYKFFSRIVGIKYLFNCIARVIMELEILGRRTQAGVEGNSKGGMDSANEVSLLSMNMELDQTKALGDDIDTDTNLLQLQLICRKLLTVVIKTSVHNIPADFRKIFIEIDNSVMGRFAGSHDAVYKGIGGLFFLRFICPALTAPHVYGLLETPPNQVTQRQLVLITKVIQTIANMQEPGKKEEYMAALSDFIIASIPKIVTFYDNLRMAVNLPESGESDDQHLDVPEEVTLNGLATIWNFMFTMKDKMRSWAASEECPFNEEEKAALAEIIDECEREYTSAPKKLKANATDELQKQNSKKKLKK